MWTFDNDYNKWNVSSDKLPKDNFDYLRQELSAVRFYSKCLSGATYLPVNDLEDIYDILTTRKNRNWYISSGGSPYTNTLIPAQYPSPISSDSSYDFFNRSLPEYNMTLKNLFTPYRLMKDSLENYIYVDVATTGNLDDLFEFNDNRIIDDLKLVNGHKILVKNQVTDIVLQSTVNADEYFRGNYNISQNLGATIEYNYLNEDNGIYEYRDGQMIKTADLDVYDRCVRFSVIVGEGTINREKQFHLVRLKNGYFPSVVLGDPFEFAEKKNWILRNRVDYNNLFEINYYDVIKHQPQSYNLLGFTYSIPERTIVVGEFGIIINYQNGVQNIINNKYKVNLRGITQTSKYYWICGDDGILLRVTKHDFEVTRIEVDCSCPRKLVTTNLRSISFFDELRGVAVGDLNTILLTENGGTDWKRIRIEQFDKYYFNTSIFYSDTKFFVAGNGGVFLEFIKDISGWTAIRRRVSRFIDDLEEYILVDNINKIYKTTLDNWSLTFSFTGQTSSNPKEILFLVGDDSKFIAYDINDSVNQYDFLYMDFPRKYGDIKNIVREGTSSNFYFTGIDELTFDTGLFKFNLNNFSYIGVGNTYSNSIQSSFLPEYVSELYSNNIFDYQGEDFLMCGNESLLRTSTYSSSFNLQILDENFESRLKSKLLFLDYDVASKLNFFTDAGDYRLPDPVSFAFTASTGYFIEFDQLVNGATAPSYMTQSEHNWFEYWQDGSMTFEYYSNSALTDSTKVLISPKFSYSSLSPSKSISSVTTLVSDILPLAPQIIEATASRFNGFGKTPISAPSVIKDLYLYDYLMVARLSSTFPVVSGDVIRLKSSVVESNFIVNKIVEFGSNKYAYMFTEFNQNIIKQLQISTHSITITNLNKFNSLANLKQSFDFHPFSIGYDLELSKGVEQNKIILDFANGNATASYTGFTFSGSFDTWVPVGRASFDGNDGIITTSDGVDYIYSPFIGNCDLIEYNYFFTGGTFIGSPSSISVDVWSYTASTWQTKDTLNSPNNSRPASGYRSVNVSGYNKFRFTLTTTIMTSDEPKIIGLDRIVFSTGCKLSVDQTIYGLTYSQSDFVSINAKFNNFTSYYNLAQSVLTPYYEHEMRYRSGFLKFGYTPTFNLLDYMESINDLGSPTPKFYALKEYYSMPNYEAIPMPGISNFDKQHVYIDYNGLPYSNVPSNKLLFGADRKLEWESLLTNTFVDIKLYDSSSWVSPSSITERLLILNKYVIPATAVSLTQSQAFETYVIEFDKSINLTLGTPLYFIDILSRRKLSQISEDLQILNNIQRLNNNNTYLSGTPSLYQANFTNFNRYYNFKINTDSYAKYMLSDFDTLDNITAVIYTDNKNEFCMNVTKLDINFNIPISNTANYFGKLFIYCSEKHELKTGDGVVLEFNGGVGSSQELNPQYSGYNPVVVINQYNFYIDIPYGQQPLVGIDSGFVKYVKRDPFLNYQPIDLIEVGVDKKGRQSIEILVENTLLTTNKFSLVNIDFERFRYRLVDGLTLDEITSNFPWILEAEITGAIIGRNESGIVWYKGNWECGRWFGGTWISGAWVSGDWYGGTWQSKKIKDNFINVEVDNKSSDVIQSTWYSGRWYDGVWTNGTWVNGRWYGGNWNDGEWYKGIWNDGTWDNGKFLGGIWVLGQWNKGIFSCDNEPAYWLDGSWNGGDFENGMWFNGTWQEKNTAARFGVNAYNSRTAIWHGGKWLSGSFHSKINLDSKGLHDVSEKHRYSVWYTGLWQNGDFYGGVAYNMDFKSGIWYGGILEDIQVIGFTGSVTTSQNYFTLNGIFRFNTGDEITFIDNQIGNTYSNSFGSNSNPKIYKVLYTVEDQSNKWTHVYVDKQITTGVNPPVDLGLRLVSRFRNCNWKSGIWTNGIYEAGLWEGGIWYNGVLGQNATWM